MSTIFEWKREEMEHLLATCERDGLLAYVLRYLRRTRPMLESGCGAGRYLRFLQDRDWAITGLEWSGETVLLVKSLWPDLRIVRGDAAESPFREDSFGSALSLGVVEHWIEGPERPLADLFRVLEPGGIALITVPCLNAVRRLKRALWWDEITALPRAIAVRLLRRQRRPMTRFDRRYRYAVHPTYGEFFEYRLTPVEFRSRLERAGFEVIELVPHGEMDGIYHELNPFGLLVKFRDWRFHPSRLGRWLDGRLGRHPFVHCHMQLAVCRKPN